MILAPNTGSRCPVYIVIDVSGSIAPYLSQVQSGLNQIFDELKRSPQVCESAAVSVITFSTTPTTLIPLTDLAQITPDRVPQLQAGGGTNTGTALEYATNAARNEVNLQSVNGMPADSRALLIVMTDGQANDKEELMRGVDEMNNYKWGDKLVLGCGEVDEAELEAIGGKGHYILFDNVDPETFRKFFRIITRTITLHVTTSGKSQGNHNGTVVEGVVAGLKANGGDVDPGSAIQDFVVKKDY